MYGANIARGIDGTDPQESPAEKLGGGFFFMELLQLLINLFVQNPLILLPVSTPPIRCCAKLSLR